MTVTADTKFTIADITSTLTSTPPTKTNISAITSTPINIDSISDIGSILDIEIVPKSDIEVVPNVDEFTTNVHREVGVDDNYVVLGNGIFDKLMETATEHLAVQFANGRIRGEDYSAAYIQVFQATLQAALTAWLQKGLNEKQLALELASKNAELKLQIDVKNAELKLQTEVKNAELELQADIKNAELKSQTDVKSAELKLQADLSKNQGDLQWATALLQRDTQEALIDAQIETEKAKRSLHIRQIEAFDEDYKQKILKILLDAWSVCFSVAKDAFEAEGMPAPISKVAIDSVFNEYVIKDLDNYIYGRNTVKK